MKTVRIRMVVEYDISVEDGLSDADIEFNRNDGTWCANNAITELAEIFEADDAACMCPVARFEVIKGVKQ